MSSDETIVPQTRTTHIQQEQPVSAIIGLLGTIIRQTDRQTDPQPEGAGKYKQ